MIEIMRETLFKLKEFLLNLFFPKICEGCGEVGTYLCDKCMKSKIEFTQKHKCHVCKKAVGKRYKVEGGQEFNVSDRIKNPLRHLEQCKYKLVHKKCMARTALDGVFVAAKYSKFIENFIGDIKYEFYYAMVDDLVRVVEYYFSSEIGRNYKTILSESLITFVPLNPWRRRWRGFNQSELLAVKLTKLWNLKCVKLLKRVKNTKKQVGLKRVQRLKNLKEAFKVERETAKQLTAKQKSKIIIIDDVMTTGATLEECAKVLKDAGFRRVYGLVVARG
jgi:competence protein ComFC